MLTETFAATADLMEQARQDILTLQAFPPEQWHMIWDHPNTNGYR